MKRFFILIATLWCALASPSQAERTLTVFAAASLAGALDEIAESFDGKVLISYGGSGAIARQVAAGAPADLAILANTEWTNWLFDQGLTKDHPPEAIAGNTLVLIYGPTAKVGGAFSTIDHMLGTGRLAMGQRDAVPAGIYARQWLEHTGQWQSVVGRLAETDNVRAALALVATGATPVGIVYASDAALEPRVHVALRMHEDTHDPIVYMAAPITAKGLAFLMHLRTPASQSVLERHAFKRLTP